MNPVYDVLLGALKNGASEEEIDKALTDAGYVKTPEKVEISGSQVTIDNLSGGKNYVLTSEITELVISNVENSEKEDWLTFTLAANANVTIPPSCDLCPKDFTFEGETSYKIVVVDNCVYVAPYTPGVSE